MRLRYLHLPRCGPLTDASIVFGREDLIDGILYPPRIGSLNFLVGVNGSGKSSLLRAIYRIFRSLSVREWPALPVTLAWDRTLGSDTATALLHFTNRKDAPSYFATFKSVPPAARRRDWEEISAAVGNGEPHPLAQGLEIDISPEAVKNPLLFARLPKRLIAYTSGDVDPWEQIELPVFHPMNEEEGLYRTEDERPPGWSMDREWEEVQHLRISRAWEKAVDAKQSLDFKTGANVSFLPRVIDVSTEIFPQLQKSEPERDIIHKKVLTNRMLSNEPQDGTYFRLDSRHLRFAGIILALWQTAKELAGCDGENQREALRETLLQQRGADEKPKDARRILNEIDWFWPTHLSLTYRDTDDRVSPRQHQELLCLVALADDVIAQPRGRQRAVLSLGPSAGINLTERLKDAFPHDMPSKAVELIAQRVNGCKTGAEAILRILSVDANIDSTPMDVFSRLRDWEHTGLLEEITLTVKRLHRRESTDSESDDIVVAYDQLSDGEQMLLGRMGLLFLLRGQDGSLLFLDEPETHFNDVWKREIVEMVDMGLLNSTKANVIISTHTSIALTDAFAAEVTVLDKTEGGITARGVTGGLLGTDPGEVNMNLFRADASIGRRSEELLDRLLKTDWKDREAELEAILDVLGSSFHRAELRAILKRLRAKKNGVAPR